MTDQDIKRNIDESLKSFSSGNFSKNALALFGALGYNTSRQNPFAHKTTAEFEDNFGHAFAEKNFNKDKAKFSEWKSVDLLFQLSREELSSQQGLFDSNKINWVGEDEKTVIETYLFFAIELTQPEYSRTDLAQITREVNKIFPMPVMIIFRHGQTLTLSIIDRRLHKRDAQKDVLKKVTLIKDISVLSPHRAHIEILFDLSLDELRRVQKFTNFVELHQAWQKTLDTKELNKRFYRELANWYFWAVKNVSFPNDVADDKDDTVFNSESVIRMLTRLIFIWFIKEKHLIPENIFDEKELKGMVKNFNTSGSTVFYRAILQNLFFATLNKKIEERAFATDGTFEQNKKNYGIKNLYRYSSDFNISKEVVMKMFAGVPFLNGGLFDCLDYEDEKGKVLYLDGFSRNFKKQAQVPDKLFFAREHTIDLSDVYDDKKRKNEKVKGLFEIFNHYKFTITENTPIEEEIALDPELLGRVFENLLASYNPETQTTARKQTGSFYTPREIVNYMVDESLKAYLKQNLETEAKMKPHDADAGLEILFTYTEKEHAFTGKETKTLIDAIDNCKILDPACGSGAFPMGILHKLVHILHKLDPQNEQWKERQISKARQIDDPAIREQAVADIEAAFTNNELDYGRKLYLIENCIYGVDIQPIATQISKLRFFISLIVDQKADKARDNFGIRPLPNLETKFVAANTLIGLDKPQTGGQTKLKNMEIWALEDELKALRHQYFNAGTRTEKRTYQKKDQDLREKISTLLARENDWDKASAKQVAAFDPYDQNASSPFFDPEWMFGITEGFDVVIGNPPYIQIQNFSGKQQQKQWERQKFSTYVKTGDVYCLFYEKGYQILKSGGTLIYITSNKWMRANYGKALRKFFAANTKPLKLIDFENYSVFEATVNTNILLIVKGENNHPLRAVSIKNDFEETINVSDYLKKRGVVLPVLGEDSWLISSSAVSDVKAKIEKIGVPLKNWDVSIYRGILTGLNEAFIITEQKKAELITQDPKSAEIMKPILLGKNIKRYRIKREDLWLLFIPWHFPVNNNSLISGASKEAESLFQKEYPAVYLYLLTHKANLSNRNLSETGIRYEWYALQRCAASYYGEFLKQKIVWGNLALSSQFALAEEDIVINAPSTMITPADKYLLAVLNSKVGDYYIRSLGVTRSGGYFEYKPMFVERLPVPEISGEIKPLFDSLVKGIILYNALDKSSQSVFLESVIDAMVYDLYFPEEIKAANAEVLKNLTGLPELKEDWSDKKKLETIEKVYRELADGKHPVAKAMARQKTIPEVRIIEGLEK